MYSTTSISVPTIRLYYYRLDIWSHLEILLIQLNGNSRISEIQKFLFENYCTLYRKRPYPHVPTGGRLREKNLHFSFAYFKHIISWMCIMSVQYQSSKFKFFMSDSF